MTRVHLSPPSDLLEKFKISAEKSGVPLARQILFYAEKGMEAEEDLSLSQLGEQRKKDTKNWLKSDEIWS